MKGLEINIRIFAGCNQSEALYNVELYGGRFPFLHYKKMVGATLFL